MPHQFNKYLLPGLYGVFLALPFNLSAATDFNLADVPLSAISSVEPNVMLLLDNSGSMDNVTWYQGNGLKDTDPAYIPPYDPLTLYTDWSNTGSKWSPTSTFMTIASINGGNNKQDGACIPQNTLANDTVIIKELINGISKDVTYSVPRYMIEGISSGASRCLILPDILDKGNTRYTGNYLNYLFQYFASGSDLTKIIPFKTRMMVMKGVTTNLINTTTGMRFGLTVFSNNDKGLLKTGCGVTDANKLITADIAGLSAKTGTPLASALYEVTRYFRGMTASGTNSKYTSPIQYSCQKNFVIAITDGLPTGDTTFDTSDPAINTYCPSGTCTLPNWDGIGEKNPPYSDPKLRFSDGTGTAAEGGALYFDDIAKFAHDIDMKTGGDFDIPPFDKQYLETFAVGFSISNQMLRDAGHYGSGRSASDAEVEPPTNYFTADDEQQLQAKLQVALTTIEGKAGSAASVAAATGFVGSGTSLYQGLYDTKTWTGNLALRELKIIPASPPTQPNPTVVISNPTVYAAARLETKLKQTGGAANRNIMSFNPEITQLNPGDGAINFVWDSLSTSQQAYLENKEILNYIRGDQSCEISTASPSCTSPTLRDRSISNMLGTIVNSTPIYIANSLEYYPSVWNGDKEPENADGVQKYYDFKTTTKTRQPFVYVGANDGMLHVFDAVTLDEVMAYVPSAVYRHLAGYSDPNHKHNFYVDGTPNVIDAFFGNNVGGNDKWHTILVGGLNKGGQGVYALDITDPDLFKLGNEKKVVLWEFTDDYDEDGNPANGKDGADLGYTFSRPAIIRMHNGEWAAVFGNGYNNTEIDEGDTNGDGVIDANDDTGKNDSTTGNAVLYIVNLRTGKLITKIDTKVGTAQDPTGKNRPNGLSTVAPVDVDDDYIVDYIYAGDLFGNLWRFDVTGPTAGTWKIFGKGGSGKKDPIFKSVDNAGSPQPITARPDVTVTDSGGLMIYFGTGQYLQLTDITDKSIQSFYGLLDNPMIDKGAGKSPEVTRKNMVKQTIISEPSYTSGGVTEKVRQFSQNAKTNNYTSWYIDLLVTGTPPQGERVIGAPIVRGISRKKIVFTSIIPTQDVCGFGGESWLIELDARNGNLTTNPVFDLNFDGVLDSQDNGGSSGNVVYNGWSQKGIMTTPAILKDKIEYKITSGSTGIPRAVGEAPDREREGERQSWRQIK